MKGSGTSELELMQARVEFIPDGWDFDYLSAAYRIRNTFRKPISESERSKIPGNYPYYGPTKIQDYISDFEQDGEFALIGEDGDHFLKYRHQPMTQLISGKCTVNNHAHIIEGTDRASREWFYYYFMHRDIFSFLTRQGAGRYKLNKLTLEKLPLLLPPTVEQKKIAQILSTWDKAITTTEQLLANSQQQKKALMQQLLTGKRRLPGFYGEWKESELGEVFSERVDTGNDDLPLLSITANEGVIHRAGVGRKDTSNADKAKYRRICPGDIGYNTMRMWQGVSGYSQFEGIVSPAYTIVTPNKAVNVEYASTAFKTPKLIHRFYRHSQGMVSDTWNLKYPHFAKVRWIFPPIEEQKAIASIFRTVNEQISLLRLEVERLSLEKKALLQQLLTGKRRVTIDEATA